jgi:hypothetical protein
VFSFEPLCHGDFGSQKYTLTPVSTTSPTDQQSNATTRPTQGLSRSPHAHPTTTAKNTTQQAETGVSNPPTPTESSPSTVTDPTGRLSTAATHQPPTDPTTRSAQQQTTVPSCTSIETSPVQSDATTPRNRRQYVRLPVVPHRMMAEVPARTRSCPCSLSIQICLRC